MFNFKSSIRETNSNIVLSEIINHPEISRASISRLTGLNKATVSEIVRQLIEGNYVIETKRGESTSTGGRRPILLTINKKAGVSFSFDIRHDRISYLITYLDGEKIDYHTETRTIHKNNVIDLITSYVIEYQAILNRSPFGIIGVAISIHGIVHKNRIAMTPYFDIDELDLVESLEKTLDLPIHIENEANLSALAESAFDVEHHNLISFSVHTGIGAGIILNQSLYRGIHGRSGEVGHTILYPDGITCPCGNHGCFEQYCSTTALVRRFQELKEDNHATFEDLVLSYHNKDSATLNLVLKYTKDLGIGLMNIIGTYDPEVIYINSEVVEEIPEILSLLRHYLSLTIYKNVPLEQSFLGKKASLYGATVMNLKAFFQVNALEFSLDKEKVLEA